VGAGETLNMTLRQSIYDGLTRSCPDWAAKELIVSNVRDEVLIFFEEVFNQVLLEDANDALHQIWQAIHADAPVAVQKKEKSCASPTA
jgi:hypothetical protein